MNWFDAHCHLQDEVFLADWPGVIREAEAVGVRGFVCCGTRESDWPRVAQLAAEVPGLIPSFGIHPWYLQDRSTDWLKRLETLLRTVPLAGVGEIGLDHVREPRNDEEQAAVFKAQLRVARDYGRPVSLHCRKAWGRLFESLDEIGGLPAGGVVHSFSGAAALVPRIEGYGLHISFSGSITRPGNTRGPAAVQRVSADRLLIETDSPDLTPAGVADPVNRPSNLPRVADVVARLRGLALVDLAALTVANARRLWR